MFLSTLLAAVSEDTTHIVTLISFIALAVLIVVLLLLSIFNKSFTTTEIAFAGICLATSFVLSFIKVSPVVYGGSITLASFVPLLIYAYKFGPIKGTLTGLIFGVLNFITDPYILTPMSFVLDYLLAFASIGIMGIAPKFGKLSTTLKVTLGTICVYVLRFIFHLLSGFIYFQEGAIWVSLPEWALVNSFIYSFIYQLIYIPGDAIISIGVLIALSKTNTLDRLFAIVDRSAKKTKTATDSNAEGVTASDESTTETTDSEANIDKNTEQGQNSTK